ncbi:hypothetical protein THRCLA_06574 [Thraustotheca clavata]|uniref:Nucleotide-diphospho-sugar transferase n=1 Tax=Thraustotheca clavata TaxID=74557 RepID=A0A1V9ZMP2_9STRA|nr:hypothetical protein THRCLA_06574 [Thraustotheca clavata]
MGITLLCLLYNYYTLYQALHEPPVYSRRYSIPDSALHRNWSSERDPTIDFDDVFGRITNYEPKFPQVVRGIVLCVHNRIVPMAMSLLRELRALGNYEYVQIYHCLPDELDYQAMEMFLEDPLVEIIDLCSYMTQAGYFATEETSIAFQNFWLKPLAVLFSSFNQVMLIDADDIFFENPNSLWESKAYIDTGTLFFHDRVIDIRMFLNTEINVTLPSGKNQTTRYVGEFFKNFYFNEAGILSKHTPSSQLLKSMVWNGYTAHEQDSSVVLIDKVRAGYWVLRVLWTLITHSRFDPICYSWGDKESFWLAFELTGMPYRFSDWNCAVVSRLNDHYISNDTLCGSLAQYHPDTNSTPKVLFINGQNVINPYPSFDAPYVPLDQHLLELEENIPLDVTPRHHRKPTIANRGTYEESCLIGEGSMPLNQHAAILQRIKWAGKIAQELKPPLREEVVEDDLDFTEAMFILIVVLVPVFFIVLKAIPPISKEQLCV